MHAVVDRGRCCSPGIVAAQARPTSRRRLPKFRLCLGLSLGVAGQRLRAAFIAIRKCMPADAAAAPHIYLARYPAMLHANVC